MNTSKYNITVTFSGVAHSAIITLNTLGNTFNGTIDHSEFGQGQINGTITPTADTAKLDGTAYLSGHSVDLEAVLSGDMITGSLSYAWFMSASFSGTKTE